MRREPAQQAQGRAVQAAGRAGTPACLCSRSRIDVARARRDKRKGWLMSHRGAVGQIPWVCRKESGFYSG